MLRLSMFIIIMLQEVSREDFPKIIVVASCSLCLKMCGCDRDKRQQNWDESKHSLGVIFSVNNVSR